MSRRLRQNPRLIPLAEGQILTMAREYLSVIAEEARHNAVKYPKAAEEQIGYLDLKLPVVDAVVDNKRRGAGKAESRFMVRLYTHYHRYNLEEIRAIGQGASWNCGDDIPGASISQTNSRHIREITVELCSSLTLRDLQFADSSTGMLKRLVHVLLHEMTHASEVGKPQNYPSPIGSLPLSKDPRYYNHPWEVRAYATTIARAAEKEYRRQRRMKITAKYTGDTLESDLRWILEDIPEYNRIMRHLTPANQKKVLQLVVRHLDEKGLFE